MGEINESNWYGDDGEALDSGNTGSAKAPVTEEPQGRTDDDLAESMYGDPDKVPEVQGNPYRLDGDDMDDRLYGESDRVDLDPELVLTDFVETEEELGNLTTNLSYIASEVGADQATMTTLVEASREYQLQPLNDDQCEARHAETLEALRSQYGRNLREELGKAQALIQTLPEVAEFMDRTGAGNDLTIVRTAIRLANTQRGAERISALMKMIESHSA